MNRDMYWLVPAGVQGTGDTSIALVTAYLPMVVRLPNGPVGSFPRLPNEEARVGEGS
jgi:hypothetical protein